MVPARVRRLTTWIGLLLLTTACAATPDPMAMTPPPVVHHEAYMPTGQAVPAPQGFRMLCLRDPAECSGGTDAPRPMTWTEQRSRDLETVNAYVNGFPENTDEANFHQREYWTEANPVRGGDCEDLALEKRRLLIQRGWRNEDLLLAMVTTATGEAHVVLIAVTDQGEYVLDNRNWAIIPWGYAPFTWEKRQSRERPAVWVELNPQRFTGEALKLPPLDQRATVIAAGSKSPPSGDATTSGLGTPFAP